MSIFDSVRQPLNATTFLRSNKEADTAAADEQKRRVSMRNMKEVATQLERDSNQKAASEAMGECICLCVFVHLFCAHACHMCLDVLVLVSLHAHTEEEKSLRMAMDNKLEVHSAIERKNNQKEVRVSVCYCVFI